MTNKVVNVFVKSRCWMCDRNGTAQRFSWYRTRAIESNKVGLGFDDVVHISNRLFLL